MLRPFTEAKLSMRLPPTVDAAKRREQHEGSCSKRDPPYGAKVIVPCERARHGWNAPATRRGWSRAAKRPRKPRSVKPMAMMGEGGSIPFMAMLGEKFPQAQFVVTGVLGPHSNAHGPNEFLHIPTGKRVTEVVARAAAHAAR